MAKQTWVNINNNWKKVKNVWLNVGGVWKQYVIPKGVVSSVWKEFMSYITSLIGELVYENTSYNARAIIAPPDNDNYIYIATKYYTRKMNSSNGNYVSSYTHSTNHSLPQIGISTNGQYLYTEKSGSSGDCVVCLNTSNWGVVWTSDEYGSYIDQMAVSPTGDYIYVESDNDLNCINAGSGAHVWSYTPINMISSGVVSPDGNYIYVAESGELNKYTLPGRSLVVSVATTFIPTTDMAVSSDGSILYTVDGSCRAYSTSDLSELWHVAASPDAQYSLSVSTDEATIYMAGANGHIRSVDVASKSLGWTYTVPSGGIVYGTSLSRDDSFLYACTDNALIKIK